MQLPEDIAKSLFDILDAIDAIEEFLGGRRDFNAYRRNRMLRQAIERNLEIIGEATSRILKLDPSFPIAGARKIVDMRNWVIHAYDNINDATIWTIVNKHLPHLRKDVDKLLG